SFFSRPRRAPPSTLFPYTTLFRSALRGDHQVRLPSPSQALGLYRCTVRQAPPPGQDRVQLERLSQALHQQGHERVAAIVHLAREDRKSTRLNSSHVKSSYAVFCLK